MSDRPKNRVRLRRSRVALLSRTARDVGQHATARRRERKHAMINTLTRWEPMELADVENRLSRFFGRRTTNGREDITIADWEPLADITEDEKEYIIKAELPDVKKEDVK